MLAEPCIPFALATLMSFAFENLDVYNLSETESLVCREQLTVIGKMLTNLGKAHE